MLIINFFVTFEMGDSKADKWNVKVRYSEMDP